MTVPSSDDEPRRVWRRPGAETSGPRRVWRNTAKPSVRSAGDITNNTAPVEVVVAHDDGKQSSTVVVSATFESLPEQDVADSGVKNDSTSEKEGIPAETDDLVLPRQEGLPAEAACDDEVTAEADGDIKKALQMSPDEEESAALEPSMSKKQIKRIRKRQEEIAEAARRKKDLEAQRTQGKADEKEGAIIKEIELLENAIIWCKRLLPKEVEQKPQKRDVEYDVPKYAEVLTPKESRDEFYLAPTKKKDAKKEKRKAREAVTHTAGTLQIFEYLGLRAPLEMTEVDSTLVKLLARLKRLKPETSAPTDPEEADVKVADCGVEEADVKVENTSDENGSQDEGGGGGSDEAGNRQFRPKEGEASGTINDEPGECAAGTVIEEIEVEGHAPGRPVEHGLERQVPRLQEEVQALAEAAGVPASSEGAFEKLFALVRDTDSEAEPFLVLVFPMVLSLIGDADMRMAESAADWVDALFSKIGPYAVGLLTPALLKGIGRKAKPLVREASLGFIVSLAQRFPKSIRHELAVLMLPVAEETCDAKMEVRVAAVECMEVICACTGNKDLEPFLPSVVKAAQSISNTHACVEQLAGCIFVQNVETPALAATLPVLFRGLKDKSIEVVRTCCLIVDNMCKLVEDPAEVLPLLPQLEHLVTSAAARIPDPEARGVAEKTLATLRKAAGGENVQKVRVEQNEAMGIIDTALKASGVEGVAEVTLLHVAGLAAMAANMRCFDKQQWREHVGHVAPFPTVIETIRLKMEVALDPDLEIEEEDDEGVDLYKGSFSLAYGTLTLLRDARMHLKRNRFYGLLGPNQCGKTTLMRAITNELLEGFPKRDELKSVFVEHEIEDEEVGVQDDGFPIMSVDKPGWWWVMHTCNDSYKLAEAVTEEQVKELMKQTGFGYPGGPSRAANLDYPVTTYSGGWKMKMQLCAAQLMKADVLMLDEPTGHLDVDNVRWLEDWLEGFTGSIICVSHFTPFLDKMCTHMIDFQDRKLKTFKGEKGSTLTRFVEKYPDKKAYFELSNETMRFTFPLPGMMQGVKSRSKVILRMNNVGYQYPTQPAPTIQDVNLTVSQVSRVAVIGANGAGKSTAIKVLVGELVANLGNIWKAPGLRLAYVAQHALHHLEKHMQETPTQYIMWRFAGNEDKESLEFKSDELTVDEESARATHWCVDGVTGSVRLCWTMDQDDKKAKQDAKNIVVPDAILGRRQRKKENTYEYEVKWQLKAVDSACWVERETLIKMGYLKIVQREDEKQAAMAGLMTKQLTQPGIEKHLSEFGVEAESASHTQINQLSGGMKVKVVLAAAMWQNPHVLILDEPTNYLDREGLGALAEAIREFQGGVLVISHNREFCDGVATEKWIMSQGRLRIEGESVGAGDSALDEALKQEDVYDGAGNKIDVSKHQHLTGKERKKEIKDLEKRLKDGKKSKTLSDEVQWELEDKLTLLKEEEAKLLLERRGDTQTTATASVGKQ